MKKILKIILKSHILFSKNTTIVFQDIVQTWKLVMICLKKNKNTCKVVEKLDAKKIKIWPKHGKPTTKVKTRKKDFNLAVNSNDQKLTTGTLNSPQLVFDSCLKLFKRTLLYSLCAFATRWF